MSPTITETATNSQISRKSLGLAGERCLDVTEPTSSSSPMPLRLLSLEESISRPLNLARPTAVWTRDPLFDRIRGAPISYNGEFL